jgi:subtilisin family serine protease
MVLLASVIALPAFLGIAGLSAPPEEKNQGSGAEGALLRLGTGTARLDGQAALLAAPGAQPGQYAILHVEFDSADACQALKVEGAYPLTRFQKWADVMVRVDQSAEKVLQGLTSSKGFVWLDVGDRAYVPPPPVIGPAEKTRDVRSETIVHGGVKDYKGQGVIIAVIDSGIDFHHPDFIKYEDGKPTSRVLYFWDTFSANHAREIGQPGPVSFPNKVPIGTVYSRDDLTRELRSERRRIHVWDTIGHGTSCASVAAGNGNAAGDDAAKRRYHVGVAPEADIIAVRIGTAERGLPHASLLGAICEWLERVGAKEKKPIVLSCSYGEQSGNRDGSKIIERQIDARFGAEAKDHWCRAICVSAGNQGGHRTHAAVTLGDEKARKVLKWAGSGHMTICFDTSDLKDIKVVPAAKDPFAPPPFTRPAIGVHGITKQVIWEGNLPDSGAIALYSVSGKAVKADAYLDVPQTSETEFEVGDPLTYVGSPGTATQAITVGSYDFNEVFNFSGQLLSYYVLAYSPRPHQERMIVGRLSSYSSRGPRRDGLVKPDLAAPGQYFTAAAATNLDDNARDSTGYYTRFSGTSAAAPYAAGVVSLMLQKDQSLTNAQIKELLARHVRKMDADGKPLDRNGWGNGKLDLAAVKRILDVPEP